MSSPDSRQRKIERVIEEYGLEGLGDELVERWTAEGDRRMSLRELESYFNVRVIEAAFQRESQPLLDGEAENFYRLLADSDTLEASRIEATHRLKEAGIDGDELTDDFVSHQAIYNYLTEIRGVSREAAENSPEERLDETLNTINRLQNRLVAVTEGSVKNLIEANILDQSEVRPVVLVQLECTTCGERYSVREFFEERACDCQ